MTDNVQRLINRFLIEYKKKDRSGVYGYTQTNLAYNSNKIEGSKLTENQTVLLFETQSLAMDNDLIIRTKDIEETSGHFIMFNNMLQTYNEELTEDLIKSYHKDLKCGVFEDMANGYPVGEYKNRANIIGNIKTSKPSEVHNDMKQLLKDYNLIENKTLEDIAKFHIRYESIHPFQDGNGRTGRIIMFKECLKNNIMPFIIEDDNRNEYYVALQSARSGNLADLLNLFKKEQDSYFENIKDFLYECTTEEETDNSDKSDDYEL